MTKKRFIKIIIPILSVILLAAAIFFFRLYIKISSNNINLGDAEGVYFYVYTGNDFDDVCYSLFSQNILLDQNSFLWLSEKKNLANHIYPGRYLVTGGMSNNDLINMLRSGDQAPLKLIINNIRTKNELGGLVSRYLEFDSVTIINLLNNKSHIERFGYNKDDVMTAFLPNTYEFYWNTSAEEFLERMVRENKQFWTNERLSKANEVPLTAKQVFILASIVQKETMHKDEMDEIAGVYINRLKRGMLLQADPTVIFALGDYSKKRVLKKDTKTDSPYNTYIYGGLPPGPICLPEPTVIDKVLNYKKHNFIFMCAKDDMSGYHHYTKTLREHLNYARKYQRALNKLKINN